MINLDFSILQACKYSQSHSNLNLKPVYFTTSCNAEHGRRLAINIVYLIYTIWLFSWIEPFYFNSSSKSNFNLFPCFRVMFICNTIEEMLLWKKNKWTKAKIIKTNLSCLIWTPRPIERIFVGILNFYISINRCHISTYVAYFNHR